MKTPLVAVLAVVAIGALTEAFYVPRFGKEALDAAYSDYLECVRDPPLIEPARRRRANDFRPTQADCFGAYLDRRDTILWRYFFFRTLATRL